MTRFYCCEVCERNPTCGNDCGSCEGETREELLERFGVSEAMVEDYMRQFDHRPAHARVEEKKR